MKFATGIFGCGSNSVVITSRVYIAKFLIF
jgi:hypothetical protein